MIAYLYPRCSHADQLLGDSIRRQTELLTKHAQELGMTIVLLPPDLAVSAFHGKNRTTGELAKFVPASWKNCGTVTFV